MIALAKREIVQEYCLVSNKNLSGVLEHLSLVTLSRIGCINGIGFDVLGLDQLRYSQKVEFKLALLSRIEDK